MSNKRRRRPETQTVDARALIARLSQEGWELLGRELITPLLPDGRIRMGFTRLRVIDRDRIEARNLSVQPYSRAEVGAPKARALANALYRAVQAKVEVQTVELTSANVSTLLKQSALVIDAFDNPQARAIVSDEARSSELPCLHIGFSPDGLYGNGLWERWYLVPHEEPGDPCNYPLTRPFALALAMLAARAVTDFFRTGTRYDFEMTWKDVQIRYHAVEASA